MVAQTNHQYLILTYSWTLTPIPNWTYSVVTIFHFQCTAPNMWLNNRCANPSMWLNHQLKKALGYKVLQSITRWRSRSSLVIKAYSVKTQQLLQEKDKLGQILSPVTRLCTTFVQPCNLWRLSKLSLYKFRVVRKESLNT